MARCNWFRRYWHRRLRRLDELHMLPAILNQASTLERAHDAWELFKAQPGQEHWRCPCARLHTGTGSGR